MFFNHEGTNDNLWSLVLYMGRQSCCGANFVIALCLEKATIRANAWVEYHFSYKVLASLHRCIYSAFYNNGVFYRQPWSILLIFLLLWTIDRFLAAQIAIEGFCLFFCRASISSCPNKVLVYSLDEKLNVQNAELLLFL